MKEKVHTGQVAYVSDSFELDNGGIDLWPDLQDDPRFAGLKKFVEEVDGDVFTMVTNENSLLAVEE